jgi:hypothetical protein
MAAQPFQRAPLRDAALMPTGILSGVAGLSQPSLFDGMVNELWAAILPTEEKRLRLGENKTLG